MALKRMGSRRFSKAGFIFAKLVLIDPQNALIVVCSSSNSSKAIHSFDINMKSRSLCCISLQKLILVIQECVGILGTHCSLDQLHSAAFSRYFFRGCRWCCIWLINIYCFLVATSSVLVIAVQPFWLC